LFRLRTGPLWRLFFSERRDVGRIELALDAGSITQVPPAPKPTRSMINHRRRVAMNAMFHRLSVIHKRLDDEVRQELRRRIPDDIRLLRLKKLKLAVKDRLYLAPQGRRGLTL
jgi:uncharacterized protein YdcH (DUF465 family)